MKQKLLFVFIASQAFMGINAQQFGNRTLVTPNANNVNSYIFNDIDEDGDIDIIATSSNGSISSSSNHVFWYKNLGNETFSVKTLISSSYDDVAEVKLLDIDEDGKKDLVVADRETGMSWIKNMGSGFFGTKQSLPYNSALSTFEVGDINNDGKDDIIVAELSNDNMSLVRNTGNGVFVYDSMFFIAPGGVNIRNFMFGDLDQDQVKDLIVSTGGTSSQRIIQFEYVNSALVQTSVYTNPTDPYIYNSFLVDLDQDGQTDVVSESSDCAVYWFKNFGNNVYSGITPMSLTGCNNYNFAGPADLDLDGFQDFVYFRYGNINYRKGTAVGEVDPTILPISATSTIVGEVRDTKWFDIDEDGDLDIFYNTESEFGWFANNAAELATPENVAVQFTVYPNPANAALHIFSPAGFDSYKIVDVNGKVLKKGGASVSSQSQVDLSGLGKGFYFLEVQNRGVKSVKKFIRE